MPRLTTTIVKSEQICNCLEEGIRSGRLKHKERLQTVRKLAVQFNVSTRVIVDACELLKEKNLLTGSGRRGIFINDPAQNVKKFLIIHDIRNTALESPANYITPAFKDQCISMGIQTDELHPDFLDYGDMSKIVSHLKSKGYDGVLSYGSVYSKDNQGIKVLKSLDIPVLVPRATLATGNELGLNFFYSDENNAWNEGMKLLAERGYKRIGALGLKKGKETHMRCGGIQEHLASLHSLGLTGDENSVGSLMFSEPNKFQQELGEWLGNGKRFDAIMCFSDFFALRLYQYCQSRGIIIPDDLAVLGFCGYPGGNLLHPELSTIDLQYSEIGKKAAIFLTNVKKENIHHEKTSYAIVDRESCPIKKYP